MKNSILIFILLIIILSCEDNVNDSEEKSIWQVYQEWDEEIYIGSDTVIGKPSVPTLVVQGYPLPGGSYQPSELPWTIQGFIKSGVLTLDFSDTLNLSDNYSSEFTGGIKIAQVRIQKDTWQHIALYKLNNQNVSVLIYYSDNNISCETLEGYEIQLKTGWNFWDRTNNIISQDINEFLNNGYRWRWQSMDAK